MGQRFAKNYPESLDEMESLQNQVFPNKKVRTTGLSLVIHPVGKTPKLSDVWVYSNCRIGNTKNPFTEAVMSYDMHSMYSFTNLGKLLKPSISIVSQWLAT